MPAYCKSGMEIFLLLACLFVGTGGHNETAVKCQGRESLDECLKQLPDILEKKELKGIPSSKKDVDAMCSAFKTGMNCMNSYARECLNPDSRRIMEDHVAGAKHTFSFLCDDPSFQSGPGAFQLCAFFAAKATSSGLIIHSAMTEYLTYTTCYRGITKDWDSCADRFLALVGEELARKNASRQSRLIELCCAKHGFLKCVYVSARLKCRKEEALFIQKIADTLSSVRVYTPHCSKIDVKSICSGCLKAFPFKENLFIMLFLIFKPYISL